MRRAATAIPDGERAGGAEQPTEEQPGDAPPPDPRLAGREAVEQLLLDRQLLRRPRGTGPLRIGGVGNRARPRPAGGHGGLEFVTDCTGLVEISLDRQHVRPVGADHPPLTRHLVDRQFCPKVAPQAVDGAGEGEGLSGDHSPLHHGHPEAIDVHRGRGQQQPREQSNPEGRPEYAGRERPLQPPAHESHRAGGWRVDAADAVEGGRLSGTVGADHRDHAAGRNFEVEFRHGHKPAEADRQPIHFEQRLAAERRDGAGHGRTGLAHGCAS